VCVCVCVCGLLINAATHGKALQSSCLRNATNELIDNAAEIFTSVGS